MNTRDEHEYPGAGSDRRRGERGPRGRADSGRGIHGGRAPGARGTHPPAGAGACRVARALAGARGRGTHRRVATRDAGNARRLPHRPRDRPRRHGGGLRGRADLARPPRGAQGPAVRGGARPPPAAALPERGPGRGPAAPHPHRAGLLASARARACTTTRCSSSTAAPWPR